MQSHDITSILDQRYYNNGRTKPTQGSQISNHHPVITEIELSVEGYDTGGAQKWCFISADRGALRLFSGQEMQHS